MISGLRVPFPDQVGSDVGHTPLAPLRHLFPGGANVLAKLENRNPTGSAKDRSALGLVRDAWGAGTLKPGGTVVESSSGNLAMAMARLAALLDFRFECVVDPRANVRTVSAIEAYGATVHPVTEPDPATGDWLIARIARVRALLDATPDAITLDQYSNEAAIRAHADGTMREILDEVGPPQRLYVATSTTGTIGGCLRALRDGGHDTEVVAVDAPGSVLFGGTRGTRLLSGYGAGIVPPLAVHSTPSRVRRVEDLDAVIMCRVLALTEGILAGASTGAVMAAVAADAPVRGDRVVALVHDSGMPYLDTVYDDDWTCQTFNLTSADLHRRVETLARRR